ncbi:MAG: class III extradiol ring-cleavage dioxygenase [Myxococcota bacterium]
MKDQDHDEKIDAAKPGDDEASWSRRVFLGAAAAGAAGLVMGARESNMVSGEKTGGKLPTLYIPHGGGPCFFMEWTMGPRDTWDNMANWLRSVGQRYAKPKALLVISAHWEERVVTVQSGERPALFYDYYGFPPHTYELTWPAPGAPAVAARVRSLLEKAGIPSTEDKNRGFDHGVFVPLKVAYPEAGIPTLQLSLNANLDPATHLAIGRALAPLRNEGVLIIGSGMSFHNMRAFMRQGVLGESQRFDGWLANTCCGEPPARNAGLVQWAQAPAGRFSHPREEHLLPLMVVAGAADGEAGRQVFTDQVMGVVVSAFEFGDQHA